MKKSLLFLCLFITFISCKKDKEFSFEEKVYQKILLESCIEDDCTEVKINTAEIIDPVNDITTKINQNNLVIINDILSFDENPHDVSSYDEIVSSFINSFTEMAKKFPKDSFPWKGTTQNTVTFYNNHLLSFAIEYYTFTGGAHGYKGEKAVHYNPLTGEQYNNQELFKDWEGFSKLLESKLREQRGIDKEDNINSHGLLFDEDVFKMPENIFFYEESVIAYYNSYDITAFSDEPVRITFSKEEIEPFLNFLLIPNKSNK
ncbi:DUF4163 domain-containing protein [Myroides odoratimimus]|uniref:PdaC/SigV domain-containing protein n=1 Tax=Myroides odoratimimus TaxID=76832 RepID=UPI00103B64B2|nr:DUF4163 domain-containing protein [Myroides odoratimimus]MDM1396746.1 DUF4163 domain-containing protein [Myroides odoratimimus]MDM1495631.1 DUF4163 domain-containing protein [Myroides odoratimimus]QBK75892.1 DUF3298 domain-containing protein [Myroides odoratimimus]WHT74606.1 DUF4163 domain-containing protein [Myroides odoratimimus]WHU39188.1 DUF4163 domain-containing protein [Myroides odoratimimus]